MVGEQDGSADFIARGARVDRNELVAMVIAELDEIAAQGSHPG